MTKSNGWLAIGGIFSLFATAEAQTPALSTATTAFDGTYAFVSSTKVTETYMSVTGRMGQCPEGRRVSERASQRAFFGVSARSSPPARR
jgi:hypothetical protein